MDGRDRANGFAVSVCWRAAAWIAVVLFSAIPVFAQVAATPPGHTNEATTESHAADAAVEPAHPQRKPVMLRRSSTSTDTQATPRPVDKGPATWRILTALAVVLGTILLLRWLSRRVMSGPVTGGTRAVQVVSRTVLSPKQQLMLVQVGRRLVLVGNSGTAMAPLCEITDGEEVSELLGQVQSEKSDSISKAFGNLFRRERERYDETDAATEDGMAPVAAPDDAAEESLGTSRDELNELLNKVRGLKSQFRR